MSAWTRSQNARIGVPVWELDFQGLFHGFGILELLCIASDAVALHTPALLAISTNVVCLSGL